MKSHATAAGNGPNISGTPIKPNADPMTCNLGSRNAPQLRNLIIMLRNQIKELQLK